MKSRKDEAKAVRYSAADLAFNRPHPRSVSNGDEQRLRCNRNNVDGILENIPSFINSFTKGLEHDENGFVIRPEDFEAFVRASDSGDIDTISRLPLYTKPAAWKSNIANTAKSASADKRADVRGWENMGTGQTFELEGFDPQGLAIPPAPRLISSELASEMVEMYWMALCRDVPLQSLVLIL